MMQGMHLRDLVRALGWSYGALWSMPDVMTELVWAGGSFEAKPLQRYESEYWNVESLFCTTYKSCSFLPGSGYAGKVLTEGQTLWLNGTSLLVHHSVSSSQASFFKVAGIQTLLCIPWFNSVVELGSSTLVPRNSNLLFQIREFLSHMATAAATKQPLPTNSFSPTEGPLLSQGLSAGSDDASFNGGVNNRDQQVESCSSFPLEASLPKLSPVSRSGRLQSAAAGHDLNEEVVTGSGETDDWRLDFTSSEMLQERLASSRSPTNSLQQQRQEEEEAGLDSSFLISPRQHMPLLGQLHYNQTISSSQSSSKGDSYDRPSASAVKQQLLSRGDSNKLLDAAGFAPWNTAAQKNSRGLQKNSNRSNQVVLQRCIGMTHKMHDHRPQLNASRETQNATEQQTIAAIRRGVAAAAAEEAAAEVLSGHDEAAVSHMIAERKRRQKQKENFTALKALIPFVSKMDRASILGDAINYVKQLTARVEELEILNRELEAQIPFSQRKRSRSSTITSL